MVGIGLGSAALVAAVAVPASIEALKRPRLDILPSPWSPAGPVAWTFAAIRVHNKPLGPLLNRFLTRQAAQGCRVDIDYFDWASGARVMATVPGRWSSHPEPIRSVPNPPASAAVPYSGGTAIMSPQQAFLAVYDATLDPREHDVPVSEAGEEVAVAILTPGQASAFSTASYAHPAWANPDWSLSYGTYRIVVTVSGSSVKCERAFKLEYLDADFAKFRLQRA